MTLICLNVSFSKRRLSVDLIYFRDRRHQDDASNNNRQDELVKEFPISSGNNLTHILIPNIDLSIVSTLAFFLYSTKYMKGTSFM